MNFDKLCTWALGIVIAAAAAGQLDTLETWVWKAQARVLYESRTTAWGSPRFWPESKLSGQPNERSREPASE